MIGQYDDLLRDLPAGSPGCEGNIPATVEHLVGDAWEHVKDQADGCTDGLQRAAEALRAAAAALSYEADTITRLVELETLAVLRANGVDAGMM